MTIGLAKIAVLSHIKLSLGIISSYQTKLLSDLCPMRQGWPATARLVQPVTALYAKNMVDIITRIYSYSKDSLSLLHLAVRSGNPKMVRHFASICGVTSWFFVPCPYCAAPSSSWGSVPLVCMSRVNVCSPLHRKLVSCCFALTCSCMLAGQVNGSSSGVQELKFLRKANKKNCGPFFPRLPVVDGCTPWIAHTCGK
jgi:hypothetical protein